MLYQKTSDEAPPVFYVQPVPTKSASAIATAPARPSAAPRATKAPPPAPSPEQAQAIWRQQQYAMEITGLKDQLRAEKEAAKHVDDGLIAFFSAYIAYTLIVGALSAIAFGFFGYIGVKIAARLVGPLRIRDTSPPPRPHETITLTPIGPPSRIDS